MASQPPFSIATAWGRHIVAASPLLDWADGTTTGCGSDLWGWFAGVVARHTIYYMNIEVGNNKYYLHKRYTDFLMLHQVRCPPGPPARDRRDETGDCTLPHTGLKNPTH